MLWKQLKYIWEGLNIYIYIYIYIFNFKFYKWMIKEMRQNVIFTRCIEINFVRTISNKILTNIF